MKKLLEIRAQKKLSQRDLAVKANVDQATISRIETNSLSASVEVAERLAAALDYELTPAEILWPDGMPGTEVAA